MKVMGNELLQQMQRMAMETNTQAISTQEKIPNTAQADFGNMLKSALDHVNGLQQDASALRTAFDSGDRSVSLGDVMVASQKSSVAFEATVQVRNKISEAYKEIMNMSV